MKKLFWIICCGILCIQLAGCTGWKVRKTSSVKPRVDQEFLGNRGYISGKPATEPKEPAFTERKVYEFEVEIPDWPKHKKEAKPKVESPMEDKTVWGNQGYVVGGQKKEIAQEEVQYALPAAPQPPEPVQARTYQVQKGDTLQKISMKFYGTTKKWTIIFNANKDKLKGPDKIFPGQVLNIPGQGQYRK